MKIKNPDRGVFCFTIGIVVSSEGNVVTLQCKLENHSDVYGSLSRLF